MAVAASGRLAWVTHGPKTRECTVTDHAVLMYAAFQKITSLKRAQPT